MKTDENPWTRYLPPFLVLMLVLFCWHVWPQTVLAGPPAPVTFTITQPDKVTTFEARVWGDESAYGVETIDGYTVLQDPINNYWFYAIVDNSTGTLKASPKVAGKDTPPAAARGARPLLLAVQSQVAGQGPVGVPAVPVLVILVQYSNQPAMSTEAAWIETFFSSTSSVTDYYREVSYNHFTLTPALESCGMASDDGVTGWVTLGTTHPQSGGPSIARAALSAVDGCVNYAVFDRNLDKHITADELLPVIIVAGYETSYGGTLALTPNVWGHQASVNYKSLADEVTVVPYAQFGEWHAAQWDYIGHQATIGLIAHEIGHLLGWPDLYDTSPPGNPDSEGVGEWSVMGSGLWLGTTYLGDTPAHPSAWEKWYQNWLTPRQVYETGYSLSIPRVEDHQYDSVLQLLDNPYSVDWSFDETSGIGEYFLVENRQKTGYDARLPGCGLLIWHIDESVTDSNWANSDENHKLVDLEEADGFSHLDNMVNRGDPGDPYPGAGHVTAFTDLTYPDSKLYNGSSSGVFVTDVSPGCADIKTATVAVPPSIQMNKTASPAPVIVDQVLTYTLVLTNLGPIPAVDIVITDIVPLHTTLNSGSLSSEATFSDTTPGSLIIWTPPAPLAPGHTLTRTFSVVVDLGLPDRTALTNTAYFLSATRSGNDTTSTTVASPNLSLAMMTEPVRIETTTSTITYILIVHNNGSADATGTIITTTIPVSTTYVVGSASDGGAEIVAGSGVIVWPPVTIPVAGASTCTFQVAVKAILTDGDRLINVVSVTSDQGININNLMHVETVGVQKLYLPILLKQD
jgi:M6 family metalloprotease-like protein/uncharacterized repeat protein (TIGR01451 family)